MKTAVLSFILFLFSGIITVILGYDSLSVVWTESFCQSKDTSMIYDFITKNGQCDFDLLWSYLQKPLFFFIMLQLIMQWPLLIRFAICRLYRDDRG